MTESRTEHQSVPEKPSRSHVPRHVSIIACLAMVLICLAYAYFRAVLPDFWRRHGGGIPYVMFWITAGFVVFPYRSAILPIVLLATLCTCGLEFFQLAHPEWLKPFVSTKFGAALLGAGFDWQDFPPYFIGGFLGWVLLSWLSNRFGISRRL